MNRRLEEENARLHEEISNLHLQLELQSRSLKWEGSSERRIIVLVQWN